MMMISLFDSILFCIGIWCIINSLTILMLLEGGEKMTIKQFASAVANNANVAVFSVSKLFKVINTLSGGAFYKMVKEIK